MAHHDLVRDVNDKLHTVVFPKLLLARVRALLLQQLMLLSYRVRVSLWWRTIFTRTTICLLVQCNLLPVVHVSICWFTFLPSVDSNIITPDSILRTRDFVLNMPQQFTLATNCCFYTDNLAGICVWYVSSKSLSFNVVYVVVACCIFHMTLISSPNVCF